MNRLTPMDIQHIKRLRRQRYTLQAIAKKFNRSYQRIAQICENVEKNGLVDKSTK